MRKCQTCKNKLTKRWQKKFCCHSCSAKNSNKKRLITEIMKKKMSESAKKVNRTNRFKERILIQCLNKNCNNTWLTLESQKNHKKYCSNKCKEENLYEYRSKLMKSYHKKKIINSKGKNNPHYGVSPQYYKWPYKNYQMKSS